MAVEAGVLGGIMVILMMGWPVILPESNLRAQDAGLWPGVRDGRFGFVNGEDAFVIPPRFEAARNFSDGLASVQVQGRWGFIDASGRVVIAPQFDWTHDFADGVALAGIGIQWGYVDRTGRWVAWHDMDGSPGSSASEALAAVSSDR